MKEIKEIFKLINKPYMKILPGNIAFSFMMAILPIISIIIYLMNSLGISPIISIEVIPSPIIEMISIIDNNINSILFLFISILTSSIGMDAFIIASNVIYDNTTTSYLKRKLKSLFLTLLIIIMIIINFGLLVIGDKVLDLIMIKYNINISPIVFNIMKWPIAIILIYIIINIIYLVTPSIKIDYKVVNKGSIITTLLLVLSSLVYSIYVESFLYVDRYGELSNIIVLLIWLYIISFILVLGIAINVNEFKKEIV